MTWRRCKMQIMFIRVVCGRIILRCLIVKTIILIVLVYGREQARCCIYSENQPWTNVAHIAQTTVKTQMPKSTNKLSAMTTAGFIILLLLVVNAGFMEMDLFYCCLRGQSCLMVWKTETVHVCLVLCCTWNKSYLIVECCKKSNFGQKTQCENGKKRKHRKKTIQVSNFHNAAETGVNLTGRKQKLIQKSRCLFFYGKTAQNPRKQF